MGSSLARVLAAAIVVLLLGAVPAHAAPPENQDIDAAKVHFQAADAYFQRGRYQQAIPEFEEAYRLSQLPEILYDISKCYEALGDLPQARDYLKRFIDTGKAEPADKDKLQALEDRIAAASQPGSQPATHPAPGPSARTRTWAYAAGGSGVVLLLVSAIFTVDSARMSRDIHDAADGTQPWTPALADTWRRGQRDETIAWVSGGAGFVLAAIGVTLYVLERPRERARPAGGVTVLPDLGPGRAGATLLWRF